MLPLLADTRPAIRVALYSARLDRDMMCIPFVSLEKYSLGDGVTIAIDSTLVNLNCVNYVTNI